MAALGYILLAIARLLSLLINIYTFVVAAAVIISWVNADPSNQIVRILRQLTEPAFRQARRILPRALYRTGIDFAPLLVFFALILLDTIVVGILFDVARDLLAP